MTRARHYLVLTAATTGLLLVTGPVEAAPVMSGGPERSTVTIPSPEIPGPVEFGPCPEVAEITQLAVERREISFTSHNGELVRKVAHVSFTGTLTGANGQKIAYSGHFNEFNDVRRGVVTTTGLNARAVLPDGDVVLAAGRRAVDTRTELETVAGANTFGDFNDAICEALAAV